jgi:hypothetical protein
VECLFRAGGEGLVGQRGGARSDDRRPARHRLDARQAEALVERGEDERPRTR